MSNQLDIQGELNLTTVRVKVEMMDMDALSFVTNMPYGQVVFRVLGIMRDESLTRDEATVQIFAAIPHFPIRGSIEERDDYVNTLDGYHVNVDYHDHSVYIGRNKHDNTYGRVTIGGGMDDVVWDRDAGRVGPKTLGRF